MTQDGKTPDEIPAWLRLILTSLSETKPRTTPATDRIMSVINDISAAIKASEVKVPDDLSDVYDDPRATARAESPSGRETPKAEGTLPTLRSGIYRHWKGGHYNVLGYARDASNSMPKGFTQVVYTRLDGKPGPAMFTRVVDEFLGQVCTKYGLSERACNVKTEAIGEIEHVHVLVDRFSYVGTEVPE